MGEQKRRNDQDPMREAFAKISKKLADDGKIIAAGLMLMRQDLAAKGHSDEIMAIASNAYMGGAQHLFACLMDSLDPDREPTEADLNRMSLIAAELEAWTQEQFKKMRSAPGRH